MYFRLIYIATWQYLRTNWKYLQLNWKCRRLSDTTHYIDISFDVDLPIRLAAMLLRVASKWRAGEAGLSSRALLTETLCIRGSGCFHIMLWFLHNSLLTRDLRVEALLRLLTPVNASRWKAS